MIATQEVLSSIIQVYNWSLFHQWGQVLNTKQYRLCDITRELVFDFRDLSLLLSPGIWTLVSSFLFVLRLFCLLEVHIYTVERKNQRVVVKGHHLFSKSINNYIDRPGFILMSLGQKQPLHTCLKLGELYKNVAEKKEPNRGTPSIP